MPSAAVASVTPSVPHSAEGDERPDHEHVAVGEVDQLDDAVDERVADRDERPDRSVGDAVLPGSRRACVRLPSLTTSWMP